MKQKGLGVGLLRLVPNIAFQIKGITLGIILSFRYCLSPQIWSILTKSFVVGTKKNCLTKTVLLTITYTHVEMDLLNIHTYMYG